MGTTSERVSWGTERGEERRGMEGEKAEGWRNGLLRNVEEVKNGPGRRGDKGSGGPT